MKYITTAGFLFKIILLLIILSNKLSIIKCSAQVTQSYISMGGSGNEFAECVIQTNDGGYALVGKTDSYGQGGYDGYAVKINSDGTLGWTFVIGRPASGGDDSFCSIIQTTDGGYALGGNYSLGSAGYLVKLSNTGTLEWTKTFAGAGGIRSVVQTTDGGYALGGGVASFFLIKVDNAGALQWDKTYGGSGNDFCYSMFQATDGSYVMAGATNSYGQGNYDLYVIKSDNLGVLQWTQTIGGAGSEQGRSVIQATDGGYVIAGYTNSYGAGGSSDAYIVKLDNTGVLQWTQTIGGTGSDPALSIVRAADGGYVAAGVTESYGAGTDDIYLVKLDNTGSLQWTKTFGRTFIDQGASIIKTNDEGYAVGAQMNVVAGGNYEMCMLKLDGNFNGCSYLSESSGGVAGSGGIASSGGSTGSGVTTGMGGIAATGGTLSDECAISLLVDPTNFNGTDAISFYPNPSYDGYIEYAVSGKQKHQITMQLIDVMGREVMTETRIFNDDLTHGKLNVASLNSGAYLVKVISDDKEIIHRHFVIK